jgi:diadenosine tetraphosphate (Ap4A) HIT family hydrolase
MKRVRFLAALLIASAVTLAGAETCVCDLSNAESMAERECSLCREAEKQPLDPPVFFLKDINPRKPNRWLALPRAHTHNFADMTPAARLVFWTAAIQKAHELFGDSWGLACNGDQSRTQCHAHAHIGRLRADVETQNFVLVNGPGDIPVPHDGSGFWIHPVAGQLHVHMGDQITETVLER